MEQKLRWWVSSLNYESDIKVDLSFFDQAGDSYRKIRNTIRFLLSNLYDFERKESLDVLKTKVSSFEDSSLESFMIQRLNTLQRSVHTAFEQFNFKLANQYIYDFCNDELSSFYCSISKDVLYCDAKDSLQRKNIQYCFWAILEVLLRLLGPILPHTAEEAYNSLHQETQLLLFTAPSFSVKSNEVIKNWDDILNQRQLLLKLLEDYKEKGIDNSLDAGVIFPEKFSNFNLFKLSLPDFFGVSRVEFKPIDSIEIINLQNEPRCERSWKRDGT